MKSRLKLMMIIDGRKERKKERKIPLLFAEWLTKRSYLFFHFFFRFDNGHPMFRSDKSVDDDN